MKLRVIMVLIVINIIFMGCTNINSNAIGKNSSENKKVTTSTVPMLKKITKPTTSNKYSTFSGEWICKDKKTSLDLTVDLSGHVKGNITTVVGAQVPSSSFSGTIKSNVLTSKLYDGDADSETSVGTIKLNFTNPKILKGTVKINESAKIYMNLAEGDMSFKR
jgi:hypothetical protein